MDVEGTDKILGRR